MLQHKKCEQLVDDWLMSDFFEPTRLEALKLLADCKFDEIQARFSPETSRLVFGTAGLRAMMGAGLDRMNCLTVLQTTQGLVKFLKEEGKNKMNFAADGRGVVIGFDGRHNSENFAHVAAAVFLANDIKVYLIDKPCPTPLNPFLIVREKALCGIQITASHNPKEDNGYKLYWSNGAQIIPPIDTGIAASIEQSRSVKREVFKVLDPVSCRVVRGSGNDTLFNVVNVDTVLAAYLEVIRKDVMQPTQEGVVKFAYTAMHGVGFPYFKAAFEAFGFDSTKNLIPVASQVQIDPEFPTVKFPNPEEKGALKIALAEAEETGCDYVLANDPDADRFTACEKQRDGSWYQFSGDELGLLFADWRHSSLPQDQKGLMVASVVSSRMVQALCESRNICFGDCLTGFKWIANESMRLRANGETLIHLLGYEEAIGFQLTSAVPDKDGISAACAFAQMATGSHSLGLKLTERIEAISKNEIGYFANNNGYFLIDDPNVTKEIFANFRKSGMKSLGPLPIKSVRDVTNGIDTSLPDGARSHLPATPDAEMVTIFFDNGAVVTVRASGTEPKVKYYSELKSNVSRPQAAAHLLTVVDEIKKHFFCPSLYAIREQPIF